MANKKQDEKIKVFVKEDTAVFINGKKIKVEKGQQELEKPIAQILLEDKVAEEVKWWLQ